jgi:hypothetical protein
MNHLDQLVGEWLTYNGYFVRTSVAVGLRDRGGFEGELDVVALHPGTQHLLHVECSLDALSWDQRLERFGAKFERGRRFVPQLFKGFTIPAQLDQVVILMFAGANNRDEIGGGRLLTAAQLVKEIIDGLANTSLRSGIVPETFPLVRTIQLTVAASGTPPGGRRLIPRATPDFPNPP